MASAMATLSHSTVIPIANSLAPPVPPSHKPLTTITAFSNSFGTPPSAKPNFHRLPAPPPVGLVDAYGLSEEGALKVCRRVVVGLFEGSRSLLRIDDRSRTCLYLVRLGFPSFHNYQRNLLVVGRKPLRRFCEVGLPEGLILRRRFRVMPGTVVGRSMMPVWTHLSTMPHSGLYLNQVATVPGACKVEPTGSQSMLPPIKQVCVRNSASSSTSNSTTVRTSCNPRSQSGVIDAEPVVEASCWRVDPSFLVADELPGWENVTVKNSPPSVEEPSKEVHSRTFRENVQDNVERSSTSEGSFLGDSDEEACTTSRSSRHGQNKQRSFYSRPDMIRWRLLVEGVRNPIDEEHDPNRNFRVSQHLQDVILFLESLGLDSSKMMAKYPSLGTCPVENIRAVVKFLEFNKLRRRDVVKILNNNPFLLGHSVEADFLPVVTFLLTEVGLQEKDIGKVINRCARMLTASVENQLRPTLRFLQALGFKHMSVVVSNNATLLASSVENRLIPKMEFLVGLGLSKEEAVQALIRFPAIFNYSIEKNLQPKFRYLVEDMSRGLADLRAFPQFFGYSLEYRIRPRYLFLQKRNLSLALSDLLKPTDEVFYARFQHEKLMQEKEPSYVS